MIPRHSRIVSWPSLDIAFTSVRSSVSVTDPFIVRSKRPLPSDQPRRQLPSWRAEKLTDDGGAGGSCGSRGSRGSRGGRGGAGGAGGVGGVGGAGGAT